MKLTTLQIYLPADLLFRQPYAREVECVEQVVQRRTIGRHIRVRSHRRVGEIVTGSCGNGWQTPVPLDEFDDGNMVSIAVVDHSTGGVRRNDEQWNTRAIPEEIDGLNVARVVVAAAFIEGNEDRSARPQGRSLHLIDDPRHKSFEQVELRRSRVAIQESIRLHDRNRRQIAESDVLIQAGGVLNVGFALSRIGHDVSRVLKRVTDIAIAVVGVGSGRVGRVEIPAFAEVGVGETGGSEHITNMGLRGRRNVELSVLAVQLAVTDESGVVVIQQVVRASSAARVDRRSQAGQVILDCYDTGLGRVGAITVAAARVTILIVPVVSTRLRVWFFDLIRRWGFDVAVAVAVIESVSIAKHNVIGSGATHHRLMHVVAQSEVVGEILHIGSIATLNVIDAESGRALTGGEIVERLGLRLSIGTRSDGELGPCKEIAQASAGVACRSGRCRAVSLLPHLIETVNRASSVIVILYAGREAKYAAWQVVDVLDSRVGHAVSQTRGTRGQVLVVFSEKIGFG